MVPLVCPDSGWFGSSVVATKGIGRPFLIIRASDSRRHPTRSLPTPDLVPSSYTRLAGSLVNINK